MSDIARIMASPEFRRAVAADPEIQALEASRVNPSADFYHLTKCLGSVHVFEYGGREIKGYPLTPAVWCLLWVTGNAFAHWREPEAADIETALYALTREFRDITGDFPAAAAAWFRRERLDHESVGRDLRDLICLEFAPLRMIPVSCDGNNGGAFPDYDSHYLARLCAAVYRHTGLPPDYVKFKMPLCEAHFYLCVNAAMNDPKLNIGKLNNLEIDSGILDRADEILNSMLEERDHDRQK